MSADTSSNSPSDTPPPPDVPVPESLGREGIEPRDVEPARELEAFLADERADLDAGSDPPAWQVEHASATRDDQPPDQSDGPNPLGESPEHPEQQPDDPPDDDDERIDEIVEAAATGRGNFGLGEASREIAEAAGRQHVGPDHRESSTGKALISADGLRQYRFPTFKPSWGIEQANFESRPTPSGRWTNNGHLDVRDES